MGEMANISLHKEMKVRKIKDDTCISYIQELQMNLEQIEKEVTITYAKKEIYIN
jgi:glucosamine--fructose-6-phosphate aminotransferase (isomerizing)